MEDKIVKKIKKEEPKIIKRFNLNLENFNDKVFFNPSQMIYQKIKNNLFNIRGIILEDIKEKINNDS